MPGRVLLLAATTGYQTRSFGDAAERLGVDLVFATDRCDKLDDPWRDRAIPIRFFDEDRSTAALVAAARATAIDGLLVVGDRPTVIAARVAAALGLPGNPPEAAAISRNKQLFRERLREACLPAPWFFTMGLRSATAHASVRYPCVVKPVALSGSRGVMRADDPQELAAAIERLRALLASPDVRVERNDAHGTGLVEEFIPGQEYAVDGILHHGALRVLAIFDKPDPLDGPFFEETIYVTPSRAPRQTQHAIERAVHDAVRAIGLRHGAIHAECRVNASGVFVIEVAARPIGGLCARVLRFNGEPGQAAAAGPIPLEELLLRHALGEDPARFEREATPSGVMMIPIPRRGILRRVEGIDAARRVAGVEDVRITAKADQLLVPLPEGASYLGFVFARAAAPQLVEHALRSAHAALTFTIDPELRVLTSAQTRYNHRHG